MRRTQVLPAATNPSTPQSSSSAAYYSYSEAAQVVAAMRAVLAQFRGATAAHPSDLLVDM